MKKFALAAAAFGVAFTASPAFAGVDAPSTKVSTAGIDLSTAEGQEILSQRIEVAARRVCQFDQAHTGTRIRSREARECVAKARAGVASQVAALVEDQQRGG